MRRCDACGEDRALSSGKTCQAVGHFICGDCIGTTFLGNQRRTRCPLSDGSRLQ